jgi:hypothetical protein
MSLAVLLLGSRRIWLGCIGLASCHCLLECVLFCLNACYSLFNGHLFLQKLKKSESEDGKASEGGEPASTKPKKLKKKKAKLDRKESADVVADEGEPQDAASGLDADGDSDSLQSVVGLGVLPKVLQKMVAERESVRLS